jgi:hypothetical protein
MDMPMNQMETRIGGSAGTKRLRAKVGVSGRPYDLVANRTNEEKRTPRDTVRYMNLMSAALASLGEGLALISPHNLR